MTFDASMKRIRYPSLRKLIGMICAHDVVSAWMPFVLDARGSWVVLSLSPAIDKRLCLPCVSLLVQRRSNYKGGEYLWVTRDLVASSDDPIPMYRMTASSVSARASGVSCDEPVLEWDSALSQLSCISFDELVERMVCRIERDATRFASKFAEIFAGNHHVHAVLVRLAKEVNCGVNVTPWALDVANEAWLHTRLDAWSMPWNGAADVWVLRCAIGFADRLAEFMDCASRLTGGNSMVPAAVMCSASLIRDSVVFPTL